MPMVAIVAKLHFEETGSSKFRLASVAHFVVAGRSAADCKIGSNL